MEFLSWLQKEWGVIRGAPLVGVILVFFGLLAGFTGTSWFYEQRVLSAQQAANTASLQRDFWKDQLDELKVQQKQPGTTVSKVARPRPQSAPAAAREISIPRTAALILAVLTLLIIGSFVAAVRGPAKRRGRPTQITAPVLELEVAPSEPSAAPPQRRVMVPPSVDYEAWDKLDPMFLYQAAALWAESEPPSTPMILPGPTTLRAQILGQALNRRDIHAVGRNEMHAVEVTDRTQLSRASLIGLAEKNGERPKFLFPEERASQSSSVTTKIVEIHQDDKSPPKYIQQRDGERAARAHLSFVHFVKEDRVLDKGIKQARGIIQILNPTASNLSGCVIVLESIESNGETKVVELPIVISGSPNGAFDIGPNGRRNLLLLHRKCNVVPEENVQVSVGNNQNALAAVISYQLNDNTKYIFNIRAECGPTIVTRAVFRAEVGEYEALKTKLVGQAAWRRG